jgi:hypothetical protein
VGEINIGPIVSILACLESIKSLSVQIVKLPSFFGEGTNSALLAFYTFREGTEIGSYIGTRKKTGSYESVTWGLMGILLWISTTCVQNRFREKDTKSVLFYTFAQKALFGLFVTFFHCYFSMCYYSRKNLGVLPFHRHCFGLSSGALH